MDAVDGDGPVHRLDLAADAAGHGGRVGESAHHEVGLAHRLDGVEEGGVEAARGLFTQVVVFGVAHHAHHLKAHATVRIFVGDDAADGTLVAEVVAHHG